MPEQALYLKWRPLTFDDVIGQEHITHTLRNSLRSGRLRHAYLFSGPRGTGKTTTARLMAKAVNCTHPDPGARPCNECPNCVAVNEGRYLDLIEIDAATHTGVDDVRDLRDKIAFAPGEGRYKVYIIDEVHRFTGNAFDALLKTLEEPPDHAIFVLATTEIDKVPATIKSRCLQFEFRRVSLYEVADRLEAIAQEEGLDIERGALELIARQGTGSVRDSISLLDQIVTDPGDAITLDMTQRILGTANSGAVQELVDAIIMEDVPRGLQVINAAVDSGSDPRQFGMQVVEHMRAVMLTQTAGENLVEAASEDLAIYSRQAEEIDRSHLLRAIRTFNEAINTYRGGWQPQLTLELALVETIHGPEPVAAPAQAVGSQPSYGGGSSGVQRQQAEESAGPELPDVEADASQPPVIDARAVQDNWVNMLRALHRLNQTAPAVLEHYKVYRVDGNVLYLCTDNELYFKRLYGERQKLKVVERALWEVHKVALVVQVVLVEDMEAVQPISGGQTSTEQVDDVIRTGMELGGRLVDDDGENA